MSGIVNFFKNKIVVTIIGVILIVGILYFGYTTAINKSTEPITMWVASQTIQPRTLITDDMIRQVSVPGSYVGSNIIRSKDKIVGRYSNYNTLIPEGSMFYDTTVINKEDLPDAAFVNIPAGQVAYNFPVTMESTYGNSIYPGNKIDIYMKINNENGDVMVGRLFKNITVAAVKDSSGANVFEVSDNSRTPSFIIFGLTCEYYNLLKKASYLDAYSVELYPVPSGTNTSNTELETTVTSTKLEKFVLSHTVVNDQSEFDECKVIDDDTEVDVTDKNGEVIDNNATIEG